MDEHLNPRAAAKLVIVTLEFVDVGEHLDASLLHHVFDLGLILPDCPDGAVYPQIVPAHQNPKQRALASAHSSDDVPIR